jgi:hypothetical protein
VSDGPPTSVPDDVVFTALEEAARFAGAWRWVETRLFEVLGAWVAAEPDHAAKAAYSRHSLHHAWHADAWRDLLPVVSHLDHDVLTAAPGGMAAVVDVLAATTGPDQTVERLVGAYRVMGPRTIRAYTARLECCSVVADGPTARWLRLLLVEEEDCRQEGEALLEARLVEAAVVERAGSHQVRLESLLSVPSSSGGPSSRGPSSGGSASGLAGAPAT